MLKRASVLMLASLGLIASPAFADQEQLPNLPSYYATSPPTPPLSQRAADKLWWVKNFYVTGKVGESLLNISSIKNVTSIENTPPIVKTSESANQMHYGATLGYQLRQSGIFSRIEIDYTYRGKFNYNADPFLNTASFDPPVTTLLNSNITNQTLFGKIFYDINLDMLIIPYVQGGIGLSQNKVEAKSESAIHLPDPTPPIITSGTFSNTTTNLGWDVGAGVQIKLTKHLLFDAGYEFDWLGKLKWTAVFLNPNAPLEIKSTTFYSNSITAGLTLKV